MSEEPTGFREFVDARSASLLRTAWMLTGDSHAAEDLLQTALVRTWPHWKRVSDGNPDAYVRRVMVRTNASWRSRLWRGEQPTDLVGHIDGADAAGPDGEVAERLHLAEALAALPLRQRQAVVLRYFDDLSVDDVADLMRVSTGTVKSQCAKGLAKLRTALGPHHVMEVDR